MEFRYALYLAVALAVGLLARETARALSADRLGDPTPRRWGRLWPSRSMVDPFGTLILPALILVLWGSGAAFRPPPFIYAKPLALDPMYLKKPGRDTVLVSLAGPVANLVIAVIAGFVLGAGLAGDGLRVGEAFLYANLVLFVFHLMPIPGLDGARMLALVLPPRAREVYRNLDQYLVLFMLLIFFLLGGPVLAIVDGLASALCDVVAGSNVCAF
ncbi:MAG: site-2 protease family protein [Actinomycetota bacterium]